MSDDTIVAGVFLAILVLACNAVFAENIDPDNQGWQYAYSENTGWVNFEPDIARPNVGATVTANRLLGLVWAENVGWINLSPALYGGVTNDGTGQLSGFAWGENIGWINFNPQVPGDPNHYGVTIDSSGNFSGWAWGENIGWIHFQSTFTVDWDDLANLAAQWLQAGSDLEADLDRNGKVDFLDFCNLASIWLNECPGIWRLGPASYKVRTSWTAIP